MDSKDIREDLKYIEKVKNINEGKKSKIFHFYNGMSIE